MSAAATYASKGVRVNAVAPGLVRTALTRRIWDNPKSAEASQAMHALGRLGEPDDVASLIAWLLDPSNFWVTGRVIGVDGGLACLGSHKQDITYSMKQVSAQRGRRFRKAFICPQLRVLHATGRWR